MGASNPRYVRGPSLRGAVFCPPQPVGFLASQLAFGEVPQSCQLPWLPVVSHTWTLQLVPKKMAWAMTRNLLLLQVPPCFSLSHREAPSPGSMGFNMLVLPQSLLPSNPPGPLHPIRFRPRGGVGEHSADDADFAKTVGVKPGCPSGADFASDRSGRRSEARVAPFGASSCSVRSKVRPGAQ